MSDLRGGWNTRPSKRSFSLPAVLAVAALCAGCYDSSDTRVPDVANERVAITNNQIFLNLRMSYPDSPVPVDSNIIPQKLTGASVSELKIAPVSLTLNAEILPPIVNGEVVQATSVSLKGRNTATVSYNMRGAQRLGALDYITDLTKKTPVLSSSIVFNDSDLNAVSTDGKYVYAAQSTDAAGFPFPAVFERFKIKKKKLTFEDNVRVPLSSFAATSVGTTKDEIYATSGDGGHVFAFDDKRLDLLGQFPLHDARWVAWDKDGDRVVVVQGTPGQISIFAEGEFPGGSMTLLNTFPFPGADVPESKSTVEIAGNKAFIAAGPEGVQVVCLDDGRIVGSVPRPDPASLGLDPAVVVTNAVTLDDDLMFISNGEAGIYIAQGSRKFKDSGCDDQQITILGKLRFDNLQSANHVAYKGRWLFIATGLGGVKIVRVRGT